MTKKDDILEDSWKGCPCEKGADCVGIAEDSNCAVCDALLPLDGNGDLCKKAIMERSKEAPMCANADCPVAEMIRETAEKREAAKMELMHDESNSQRTYELAVLPPREVEMPPLELPESVMSREFISAMMQGSNGNFGEGGVAGALHALREIQRDIDTQARMAKLQYALMKARAMMPDIPDDMTVLNKDKTVRYTYTSLEMLEMNIMPILAMCGLSYVFDESDDVVVKSVKYYIPEKKYKGVVERAEKTIEQDLPMVKTRLIIIGYGVELQTARNQIIDNGADRGMSANQAAHSATTYNKRILLKQTFARAALKRPADMKAALENKVSSIVQAGQQARLEDKSGD